MAKDEQEAIFEQWICSDLGLMVKVVRTVIADTLPPTSEAPLAEVQHQIRLLRNILRWYLLPVAPGLVAFLATTSSQTL